MPTNNGLASTWLMTGAAIAILGLAGCNMSNESTEAPAATAAESAASPASANAAIPASGPAAVAAMTVNAITPDNAYVDETRVQCIYPSVTTDPIQPDTSLFATTFRYASYQLTDPLFLENGRERVFKNVGDPSDAIQGPVVLVLPPGSLSRIDYLDSRPYDGGGVPVNPVYTSAQYVILAPGSSVRLSVDRDTATPRYLVTT